MARSSALLLEPIVIRTIDNRGMWPLLLCEAGLWLKSQILESCWNPSPPSYQRTFKYTSLEAYPDEQQAEAEWRFLDFIFVSMEYCQQTAMYKGCQNIKLTDVALHP